MLEIIKAKPVDKVVIEAAFEAVCPIDKSSDKYRAVVEYVPSIDQSTNLSTYIELKSFKKYLEEFKGVEIYHEDLAAKIASDICHVAKPRHVVVRLQSEYLGMNVYVVKELTC